MQKEIKEKKKEQTLRKRNAANHKDDVENEVTKTLIVFCQLSLHLCGEFGSSEL